MENIKLFLETSTIHGLGFIHSSKYKALKVFWILVVLVGFIGSGVMIYQSFQAWDDSPVKTTIETNPIADITFPKVTVCPPKNTFTDLNYDLMMIEEKNLHNDTRNELLKFAYELLHSLNHKHLIEKFSNFVDNDRYYNWYHGLTDISIPFLDAKHLNL